MKADSCLLKAYLSHLPGEFHPSKILARLWWAFGQVFHPSDNKVQHCIKSVHIRSYSVLVISLRIQSECEKMRTRITPNTDTFYAVQHSQETHYIHSNNQEKVIHKVFTSFQKM